MDATMMFYKKLSYYTKKWKKKFQEMEVRCCGPFLSLVFSAACTPFNADACRFVFVE
jgi:hypothetical protein